MYHCAIDKELFAQKITQAQTYAAEMSDAWISVSAEGALHSTLVSVDPRTSVRPQRRKRDRSRLVPEYPASERLLVLNGRPDHPGKPSRGTTAKP